MPYNTKQQVIGKLKEIFDKFTPQEPGGKPIYISGESPSGDFMFGIPVLIPDGRYYGTITIIVRDYDLIFRYSYDKDAPLIASYDILTKYKFLSIQKIDDKKEYSNAGFFRTFDVHYLELTANDGELLSRWPFHVTRPANRPQEPQKA